MNELEFEGNNIVRAARAFGKYIAANEWAQAACGVAGMLGVMALVVYYMSLS
jgi:hypothetical protein